MRGSKNYLLTKMYFSIKISQNDIFFSFLAPEIPPNSIKNRQHCFPHIFGVNNMLEIYCRKLNGVQNQHATVPTYKSLQRKSLRFSIF